MSHLILARRISSFYRYDNFVPNYRRIEEGHIAVLLDKSGIVGLARIIEITRETGTKTRQRCPKCNSTSLKPRKIKRPPLYCGKCKHDFTEAVIEKIDCEVVKAHFGGTFVPCPGAMTESKLRSACRQWNGQLAMQSIDLELIRADLLRAEPRLEEVLSSSLAAPGTLSPEESYEEDGYSPADVDEREDVLGTIRRRRGQTGFRDGLRARYRDTCVITGCALVDVLEAAHISPWRGAKDNHVENGLLLRADIHTLFDLNLLAIEPGTLVVFVALEARADYEHLHLRQLQLPHRTQPSKAALEARWDHFQRARLPTNSA